MSKYFLDYASLTIGSAATGHTLRGTGAPTYVPTYGTPVYKRAYLKFTTDATSDYHAASWDTLDADANRAAVDLVTAFTFDDQTVEELHVYIRGAAMTDFIRAAIVLSSGAIRIDKMNASAYTAGSGASAGTVTLTAGHSYFVRLTAVAGAISLKVWDASLGHDDSAIAYNLTPTGFTPTAAGWIGFGGKHSTLTGRVAAFNFMAVATNADPAVAPRTNTEYATYAASPSAKRCVTAELQATGYDSSGSPYTKTVKAYISTHGFTSKAQDTPATRHFEAHIASVPTFSRSMSNALFGQASVGFGDLVVRNPRTELIPNPSGAIRFDASNDYIDVTHNASLNFGSAGFSIGCWVDIDASQPATFPAIIDKGSGDWTSGGGQSGWHLGEVIGADSWQFRMNDGAGPLDFVTVGNLKGLGWQHIFITVDDIAASTPVLRAYLNGVQVNSATRTANSTDTAVNLQIGRWREYARHLGAAIDDVRLYNRALTATEVQATYKERLRGDEYGLKAYYAFDEATGTTAYDATTTANNGTLTNGPTRVAGAPMMAWSHKNQSGKLDAWLRMKWSRNYLVMKLGDPSWPYHDFRTIVYGRLGQPTAPSQGLIKFPIADLSDFFNKRVTSTRFSSGDYINQYKPKLLGYARAIEPPGDRATLVYTLNDGALLSSLNGKRRDSVFDYTGLALVHVGTAVDVLSVASVNAGTDTITASANHGMLAGYRLMFKELSTPPGGLFADVNYWVLAAGLTATDFKLTATQGSTTPVDITSTTTGAKFTGYGYTYDTSAGTVTLVASPAGRVIVFAASDTLFDVDGAYPARIIEEIAFTSAALSLNFKDATSFAAAVNVDLTYTAFAGLWYPAGNPPTCLDALNNLCNGTRAWYGFALDGLLQTGCVSLPAASAVKSLTTSDLKPDSLRLTDRRRAVDYSKTVDTYGPWFLTGAPTPAVAWVGGTLISDGSPQEAAQGKRTMAAYSYGAASTPIDNYPISIDAVSVGGNDTLLQTNAAFEARYVNVDKYDLGIFECQCRLGAIFHANGPLSIGDTISLEAPRLGWKQWTASDPASPDNTATIDSRLAVVKGIAVNLSGDDPFPVKLTLYRRIPGYYPTTDVN